MRRSLSLVLIFFLASFVLQAQDRKPVNEEQTVRFTKKIHDFGDVLVSDGPLEHTFIFKNLSREPLAISQVASSCGCTTPEWTREPIMPGKEGRIKVTFANDQGPYPFDKTLTVYITGATITLSRPVVLRIRGSVHDRQKSFGELYPFRIAALGLRRSDVTIGYIDQGSVKADDAQIANLSKRSIKVEAVNTTPGLTIRVSPNPIPPESTARISFSIDSRRTGRQLWGRQFFTTNFKQNGKICEGTIVVEAVFKDDFTHLTPEQVDRAAVPVIEKSYYEFGEIEAGRQIEAVYSIRNRGREPLKIYAIDTKEKGVSVVTPLPLTIKAGAVSSVTVRFDSSAHEGEMLEVLALTTNSPGKPIVNLFLTGNVLKK